MISTGADLPLFERFQVDLDAPAVDRRIGPVDADEGRQALDRRVLQNHLGEGLLAFGHGREGHRLRRLGNAQDDAGILHGEKALGHDDVEPDRGHQRADGDHERGSLVAEHPAQRRAVAGDDAVEDVLRAPVEPALL